MTSNRVRNNNQIVVRRRKIKQRTNWRHRHTCLSVLQWANVKKLHTDISSLCQSISRCVVFLSTLSSIMRTSTGSDELVILVCRRFYVLNIHFIRLLMISLSLSISKVNDIIYAPLSEFNIPPFPPHKNRTIDELSEDFATINTRFTKSELRLLFQHLRVPQRFKIRQNRHIMPGEAVFLISLTRTSLGCPFYQMSDKFGGDTRHFGNFYRLFVLHVYTTFYHWISGDSLRMYVPKIQTYRHAIWKKLISRPIRESVRLGQTIFGDIFHSVFVTFESFRVFAFLDCTEVPSCRPGVDTRLPLVWDLQRTFFSNYFKEHGLKFQVVAFPDGMIGSIFGCSIRHNDNGVLNMSGLNDYLQDILEPMGDTFVYPAIYCDAIYQLAETIINRYANPNGLE